MNHRLQQIILRSLKFAVDCLREVLNAFTVPIDGTTLLDDTLQQSLLIYRFNCLVECEQALVSLLQRSRDDLVSQITRTALGTIGSYKPSLNGTLGGPQSRKKKGSTVKPANDSKAKKGTSKTSIDGKENGRGKGKGKGKGKKAMQEVDENEDRDESLVEQNDDHDDTLFPDESDSRGNREAGPPSSMLFSHPNAKSTAHHSSISDSKLIISQIESAMESNLRPLADATGCLLGFGVLPLPFPSSYVRAENLLTSNDNNLDRSSRNTVSLTDRSILRLLQHILSCCKTFERKKNHQHSRSNVVSIDDLLNFLPASAIGKCAQEYSAVSNICTSINEMHFYSHLQQHMVFMTLQESMNTFNMSLALLNGTTEFPPSMANADPSKHLNTSNNPSRPIQVYFSFSISFSFSFHEISLT